MNLNSSLLLLLFALLGCVGCQSETAKWEFARGLNLADAGEVDSGLALMKQAVADAPGSLQMNLELARVLAEQGDRESVRLCDELLNGQQDSGRKLTLNQRKLVLNYKAQCQQELGDFEQALVTHKLSIADSLARGSTELNNLAYFRALANRELMMATKDIEKAISGQAERGGPDLYLPLTVKAAMSIGLISRLVDRQEQALETLSNMIDEIESDYANVREFVSLTLYWQIQDQFPLDASGEKKTREARNQQDIIRGILAALYTVRALLYQDLGREAECNSDRLRMRDLGFEETELAKSLPNKYRCLDSLQSAMAYLDTRGYLLSLLPWDETGFDQSLSEEDPRFRIGSYQKALADLNLALASTRMMKAALDGGVYNLQEYTPAMVAAMKSSVARTEAVILFHRMKTHRRQRRDAAAQADADEIRQLGFDPDSNLF